MWPPPPSCSDGKWMPAHLGDQHHLCIPIPSGPRDELCVVSTPLSLHTKMCVRADLARQQTPVAFPTPVSSEDDGGGPRGSEGQDKSVLCVQRPGLARPRPRASSCRAGLSKASCMPKTSQTTLEGLPSWPTEGRRPGSRPGPRRGGSAYTGSRRALLQQVAQIKTPPKRQLRTQSCQRKKEGGKASPSHTVCFLDSLAPKSRAGGAPPLFLDLPAPFMQRGVLRHR